MVIRNRELIIATRMIEAIIIEQTWTFSTEIRKTIIIINIIGNRIRDHTTMLLGMITEIMRINSQVMKIEILIN